MPHKLFYVIIFFPTFFSLQSLLITYLITLSLAKEIYCFGKSLQKVLTLGLEICTNPVLMIRKVLQLGAFNFSDCEE